MVVEDSVEALRPTVVTPYPGPWAEVEVGSPTSRANPVVEAAPWTPSPSEADPSLTLPSPVQAPSPRSETEPTPRPSKRPPAPHRVSGQATWYCVKGVSRCPRTHNSGLYAAAGPALRVGDWRGRRVQVCRDGSEQCVLVTLVDWCACGGGRVIDLFGDAFQGLGPLSRGTFPVTVRW
jgi:rare lipoprotein A (peptidoglycan hydrolase)